MEAGQGGADTWFDLAAHHPWVVVFGGPNGAGKSTAAPTILRDVLAMTEFVNADVIAAGLSGLDPDRAAVAAGRVMLARLRELADQRAAFAFETTLASRSFAPWIDQLRSRGYHFHQIFLWLPAPDAAVARVRQRVALGGHSVPEETIRRRYVRGLRNLFDLYLPLADSWALYDGSGTGGPRLVSRGLRGQPEETVDAGTWRRIRLAAGVG